MFGIDESFKKIKASVNACCMYCLISASVIFKLEGRRIVKSLSIDLCFYVNVNILCQQRCSTHSAVEMNRESVVYKSIIDIEFENLMFYVNVNNRIAYRLTSHLYCATSLLAKNVQEEYKLFSCC